MRKFQLPLFVMFLLLPSCKQQSTTLPTPKKSTIQYHKTNNDEVFYAYRRIVDANNELFVLLNLSDQKQVLDKIDLEVIDYTNVFTGEKMTIKSGTPVELDAWDYLILEK